MKFTRKPIIVDAIVWNRNGDHPLDGVAEQGVGRFRNREDVEGKVVRRYRHPSTSGEVQCQACGNLFHLHGWLDNGGEGQRVCPGNWVITTEAGVTSSMNAVTFAANYEELVLDSIDPIEPEPEVAPEPEPEVEVESSELDNAVAEPEPESEPAPEPVQEYDGLIADIADEQDAAAEADAEFNATVDDEESDEGTDEDEEQQ